MSDPWKTDKWFVSPWNYADEVTKGFEFQKRILIHDVTLRDGEQQVGMAFRMDEKIRIAEGLAALGVHRIEAGMPAVSKEDEGAIREIVKRGLGPEVFVLCRCRISDIKLAADCGVDGIVVEVPSSRHLLEHAYRWPLKKAMDASIEATSMARELGLYTTLFPVDGTREDLDWLLDLVEKVAAEGHMDALALVDTMGVVTPQAVEYWVRKARSRIDKPLEAHFHNDFGLGVANTVAALAAGASVAHTTMCGMGERSGNASLETVVMALHLLYGVDVGLDYSKLYSLGHLVAELGGHTVAANQPIIGEDLFAIESGMIVDWFRNCGEAYATEVFPFRSELVGQSAGKVVMGKGSGKSTVEFWLARIGAKASEEQIERILGLVKERSVRKKGLITDEEFRDLAAEVLAGSGTGG